MDGHAEENGKASQNGDLTPVNLVTRIKNEAEEPIQNMNGLNENVDLFNCFRRRRRGRNRYVPYCITGDQSRHTFNCSTNAGEDSKKSACFYPASSVGCKQFCCPNCKLQFSNRDSLAMHMMESVRLDGCKGSKAQKNKVLLPGLEPVVTTKHSTSSEYQNSPTNKSPTIVSTFTDRVPQQHQYFFCRVCREAFGNLDSLAMHMFIHVQQEASCKETTTPKDRQSLVSNTSLPLPESVWNNHINSALYLKSLLSTNLIDSQCPTRTDGTDSSTPKKTSNIPVLNATLSNTNTGSVDQVIERNCRSAPIYNANSDEKILSLEKEYDKPLKLESNGLQQSESPDIEKDGLDCDIHFLSKLHKCNHCKILFEDLTTYCLHMGLHNVNNPWQCNMCGKNCIDLHDFTVHSLHF